MSSPIADTVSSMSGGVISPLYSRSCRNQSGMMTWTECLWVISRQNDHLSDKLEASTCQGPRSTLPCSAHSVFRTNRQLTESHWNVLYSLCKQIFDLPACIAFLPREEHIDPASAAGTWRWAKATTTGVMASLMRLINKLRRSISIHAGRSPTKARASGGD